MHCLLPVYLNAHLIVNIPTILHSNSTSNAVNIASKVIHILGSEYTAISYKPPSTTAITIIYSTSTFYIQHANLQPVQAPRRANLHSRRASLPLIAHGIRRNLTDHKENEHSSHQCSNSRCRNRRLQDGMQGQQPQHNPPTPPLHPPRTPPLYKRPHRPPLYLPNQLRRSSQPPSPQRHPPARAQRQNTAQSHQSRPRRLARHALPQRRTKPHHRRPKSPLRQRRLAVQHRLLHRGVAQSRRYSHEPGPLPAPCGVGGSDCCCEVAACGEPRL